MKLKNVDLKINQNTQWKQFGQIKNVVEHVKHTLYIKNLKSIKLAFELLIL